MSKTKFTGGEWYWEHDESTASMIQIDSDIGSSICRLQSENNAHLIAAAPEMYAMLETSMNILRGDDFKSEVSADNIENLLAKARGEL